MLRIRMRIEVLNSVRGRSLLRNEQLQLMMSVDVYTWYSKPRPLAQIAVSETAMKDKAKKLSSA